MSFGFIFDLDGVITDTAEYHFRAWKRLAEEESIPFSRDDNDALRGVSRRQSLEILLKGTPRSETDMLDMMARKNTYYQAFLENITPKDLLPGIASFIKAARTQDIRLGLGSASKNARSVCERLGILEQLDIIGDGYSVVNPKPAPDLFIWVSGGLGLNPTDCIVFEDAEAGISAALAGGFWTVGVGPAERLSRAHYVITGFDQASVQVFINLIVKNNLDSDLDVI